MGPEFSLPICILMLWQECFISLHCAKLASANLATYQIQVNDHHWLTFFFFRSGIWAEIM